MPEHGEQAVSRPSFRRDVQGLRALAVAMVVVYHTGISFPGGFIGVDVFFVLSGFVIMRTLLFELESTGRIDLKRFAIRRVKRLMPAFALLVVVVAPLAAFIAPVDGFELGAKTAMSAAVFNANTYLTLAGDGYFAASAELNPFLHTWSLSVEEQFYFVFPAAVLMSWLVGIRLGRSGRSSVIGVLVAGSIASLAVSHVLASEMWSYTFSTFIGEVRIDERLAFFSAPTRAWEFAAGAIVGFIPSGWALSKRSAVAVSVVGAGVLGWCSLMYSVPGTTFPGLAAVLPVSGTVLLLIAGEQGAFQAALESPVVQRIGDLSYGWYLWHWPMIVFATALTVHGPLESPVVAAMAALLSLIPAELSMRVVENPARYSDRFDSDQVIRMAFGCVVALVGLGLASMTLWDKVNEPRLTEFESHFAFHYDATNGCDSATRLGNLDSTDDPGLDPCAFPADAPVGRAMLVGDSNAGHFSEGVIDGMAQINFDLEITTRSSCPFADLAVRWQANELTECRSHNDETLTRLLAEPVDLVIIGHAVDWYTSTDRFSFAKAPAAASFDNTPDGKAVLMATGTAEYVSQLRDAGMQVVVVQPVPRPLQWEPGACSVIRWGAESDSCTLEIEAAEENQSAAAIALVRERVERAGARVVDPGAQWCDAERCRTRLDGRHLYRDHFHITVFASEALAGDFAELASLVDTGRPLAFVDE